MFTSWYERISELKDQATGGKPSGGARTAARGTLTGYLI
jgi:hypothetical protein